MKKNTCKIKLKNLKKILAKNLRKTKNLDKNK